MEVQQILDSLELYDGKLPRAALKAAIDQRAEITPVLLDVFRDPRSTLDRMIEQEEYMLPTFAMYLLAQFREKAAYPLIVAFFEQPGDDPVQVTGDVVTEDLNRILASVAQGDATLIKRLAENPQVSEWTRSAALTALVTMVAVGDLPRESVIDYFRHLFHTLPRKQGDEIFGFLVVSSCDLYPEELLEEIKQAFQDKLVDLFLVNMDWVERIMSEGKEATLRDLSKDYHSTLINDTISEFKGWAAFQPEKPAPPLPSLIEPLFRKPKPSQPNPAVSQRGSTHPDLGRNDPCWCGSGKKYKQCHLRSDQG